MMKTNMTNIKRMLAMLLVIMQIAPNTVFAATVNENVYPDVDVITEETEVVEDVMAEADNAVTETIEKDIVEAGEEIPEKILGELADENIVEEGTSVSGNIIRLHYGSDVRNVVCADEYGTLDLSTEAHETTYLDGGKIKVTFETDAEPFNVYLYKVRDNTYWPEKTLNCVKDAQGKYSCEVDKGGTMLVEIRTGGWAKISFDDGLTDIDKHYRGYKISDTYFFRPIEREYFGPTTNSFWVNEIYDMAALGAKYIFGVTPIFDGYQLGIMDSEGNVTPLNKVSTVTAYISRSYYWQTDKVVLDVYEFDADKDYTVVEVRTPDPSVTKKINVINKLSSDYKVGISGLESDGTLSLSRYDEKYIYINKTKGNKLPVAKYYVDGVEKRLIPQPPRKNEIFISADYRYLIPYFELKDGDSLILEEDPTDKKISVSYPENSVEMMTLLEDYEEKAPLSSEINDGIVTDIYSVDSGANASLKCTTDSKFRITKLTVKQGNTTTEKDYSTNWYDTNSIAYNIVPYLDADVNIDIESLVTPKLQVKRGDEWCELKCENAWGDFELYPGFEYKLDVLRGHTVLSRTSDYSIDTPSLDEVIKQYPGTMEYNDSDSLTLKILDNAKLEKDISFGIGIGSGSTNKRCSFKIIQEPKALEITSEDGRGYAEVDHHTYLANINKKSDMDIFELEINYAKPEYKDLIDIELDKGGTIQVDVKSSAPLGEIADIKFVKKFKSASDTDRYFSLKSSKSTATFESYKVVATEPKTVVESPVDVAKVSQDDTYFTFDILTSYDMHNALTYSYPVDGKQYYEVKLTPDKVDGMPSQIHDRTVFVEKDWEAEDLWFEDQRYKQDEEFEQKHPGEFADESDYHFTDYPQRIKVKVSDFQDYFGIEWPYTVQISLVQTINKDELTETNASKLIRFRSKTPFVGALSTKNASYETKLSATVKAKTVYTGQSNAAVALLKYSNATVCKDATAEDITDCSDAKKLKVKVEDGKVITSVPLTAKLGEHEIEVTPVGPDTMYKRGVVIKIKVEKGIENVKIVLPTTQLYKNKTNSPSLKASALFNEGTDAPAVKKVTWQVINDEGKPCGNDITVNKNGVISIKKSLNMEGKEPLSFYVKATAADYSGNTVSAVSDEITVSDNIMVPANIRIAKYNTATKKYEFYDDGKKDFYAKELKDARLVIEDADKNVFISGIELKSSNKNVKFDADENGITIKSVVIANNVKITAKALDGGNKRTTKIINIVNFEPSEIKLKGFISDNCIGTENSNEWTYAGTVNTKIKLQLRQKLNAGDSFTDVDDATKHKIKISGGKIVAGNAIDGAYYVVVTAPRAKVTFTDNKNVKTEYVIKNSGYPETVKDKAPLKTSYKVKDTDTKSIVEGSTSGRQVVININPSKYDITGKVACVEMDALTYSKNESNYKNLERACPQIGSMISISENDLKLSIDETNLKKGKYKVVVMLGKMEGGIFVADAKPATITLSVDKPKATKGTCKAPSKLILTDENKKAEIGFSGNYSSVSVNSIRIANINGKPNEFDKYFDVVYGVKDGMKAAKIKLKDNLSSDQIAYIKGKSKDAKNDCIFFVEYTYWHGDNGYGVPIKSKVFSKVTVQFK